MPLQRDSIGWFFFRKKKTLCEYRGPAILRKTFFKNPPAIAGAQARYLRGRQKGQEG